MGEKIDHKKVLRPYRQKDTGMLFLFCDAEVEAIKAQGLEAALEFNKDFKPLHCDECKDARTVFDGTAIYPCPHCACIE